VICGYVFVTTDLGRAIEVAEGISKMESVKSACAITGVFDVIAHFEVEDIKEVGSMVVDEIHSMDGVIETQTAICVGCHGIC